MSTSCLLHSSTLSYTTLPRSPSFVVEDDISLEELKQCLQTEELTLPDLAIEKLMKEVDSNKDGNVSAI